jgi:hypothetical protein
MTDPFKAGSRSLRRLRRAVSEVLESRTLLAAPKVVASEFQFDTATHKVILTLDQRARTSTATT